MRKQVASVAAGVLLAAFGGAVTILGTPLLGWWLIVVGIGATVVALRPDWFMNKHLFGKRKVLPSLRPGAAGIQDLTLLGSGGSSVAIAARGHSEIDLLRVGIKGFGKAIDTHDSAKVTATDSELQGPSSSVPVLGRNDPCYCGSGKKFKKCHGKKPG